MQEALHGRVDGPEGHVRGRRGLHLLARVPRHLAEGRHEGLVVLDLQIVEPGVRDVAEARAVEVLRVVEQLRDDRRGEVVLARRALAHEMALVLGRVVGAVRRRLEEAVAPEIFGNTHLHQREDLSWNFWYPRCVSQIVLHAFLGPHVKTSVLRRWRRSRDIGFRKR